MPTTDSNLTGTFIANTYQKLLQVDNINGSVGTTAPFDPTVANNTSKYTLLNGLGQSVGGVVIDQTGVSGFNGGLFLKNTSTGANNDGKGSWTLQTSGDGGLNISRNSDDNYLFFLKQSGSAFVGYKNATIPADISGYSLYVKDGITANQRIQSKDYNNFIENDIYKNLADNQSYAVKRNDQIILSGRCNFIGAYGSQLTNVIVRDGNIAIPSSYTITGGYGGNGGDRSWINYNYATMYWNRVGAMVNVVIYVNEAYGGDNDEPFPNTGLGRPMLFHYPVYLIDPSTLLPYYPSGVYDVIGSGITSEKELVEIKTYTGSPSGIGTFMLSIGNNTDTNRDIRASFSYKLY